MDQVKATKLLALQAVKLEDSEYHIRRIQRWYSKEFCTPLHLVEELPLMEICQHYFEVKYEEFTSEQIEEEIQLLTETEKERQDRLRQEELDEISNEQFAADQARLAAAAAAAEEAVQEIKNTMAQLPTASEVPDLAPISMKFDVDEEEFEDSWDIFKASPSPNASKKKIP